MLALGAFLFFPLTLWCLAVVGLNFRWCFWTWPRGTDLDATVGYGEADGSSLFQFYAGFIAAQQALLGIATRGKGKEFALTSIIAVLAVITICGIIRTLRLTKFNDGTNVRAYDKSTLHFGRWVLVSSTLISAAAVVAAYAGVYPGQQPERKDYEEELIDCLIRPFTDRGEMHDLRGRVLNAAELARLGEATVTIQVLNANGSELMSFASNTGSYRFDTADPQITSGIVGSDRTLSLQFSRLDAVAQENQVTRTVPGLVAAPGRPQIIDVTVPQAKAFCTVSVCTAMLLSPPPLLVTNEAMSTHTR